MLALLTGVAVPALAFVPMLLVGLELRIEDFLRITRHPRTVLIATLGQALLLPLFLALTLVHMVSPRETLSASMMFVALSPVASISNYYTWLSGRNVALSVTLTASSTVFSLISIPIFTVVYLGRVVSLDSIFVVPTSTILLQLSLFALLPVALGMCLGRLFQGRIEKWKPHLSIISLSLVGLLLATLIWTVRGPRRKLKGHSPAGDLVHRWGSARGRIDRQTCRCRRSPRRGDRIRRAQFADRHFDQQKTGDEFRNGELRGGLFHN